MNYSPDTNAIDVRIDQFRLIRTPGDLCHGDRRVRISPKALQVLDQLIVANGATVAQNEFIRDVWADNYVVGEHGLRDAIWELRKAFGDDPRKPRYIRTLPRKGYQLIPAVEPIRPWYQAAMKQARLPVLFVLAVTISVFLVPGFHDGENGPEAWSAPPPSISGDLSNAIIEMEIEGQRDLVILNEDFSDFGNSLRSRTEFTSGSLQQITQTAGRAVSPVWATDGGKVAWMEIGTEGQCSVRVYDQTTDTLASIAQDCFEVTSPIGAVPAQLDWSADARQLVYQSRTGSDTARLSVVNMEQADFPSHHPVPRSAIPLSIEAFPRFADDGRLAFLRLHDPMMSRGEIHIVSASSNSVMRCPAAPIWGLAWADDTHLAVTASMNNPFELWLLNSHEGHYSGFDIFARHLQPRRVQDKLLIDRFHLDSDLQRVSIDGNAPPGSLETGGDVLWMDYSPATARYVAVHFENGQRHLDLIEPDGNSKRLFSNLEIYSPRFSPEGDRIGLTTRPNRWQNAQSLMIDIASGEVRRLSAASSAVFFAEWGHNGDWYGVRGVPAPLGTHGTLIQYSPDGRESRLIAHDVSLNVFRDEEGDLWWADNSGVIFHRAATARTLTVVDRLRSVYESWTLDRRTRVLYLTESGPDQTQITQRTSMGHKTDRPLNIMRAQINPLLGLVLGPDDSLFFRRSVWSWASREAVDVKRLTERLDRAKILNGQCELMELPPPEKSTLVMH